MSTITTCAVTAKVHSSDGGPPVPNAQIEVQLAYYEIYEGFVAPPPIRGTTDANGECVLDLFPNELGQGASYYKVRIQALGKTFKSTAVVPNAPTALLHEITAMPVYDGKPDGYIVLARLEEMFTYVQAVTPVFQVNAPANPVPGARWTDANTGKTYEWVVTPSSSTWMETGHEATIGYQTAIDAAASAEAAAESEATALSTLAVFAATPPLNPPPGRRWTNSNTGKTYEWIVDVDGGQWAEVGPAQSLATNAVMASLLGSNGATKVGTPEGTVQDALDGRPTATALAGGDGSGLGYSVDTAIPAFIRSTKSGFWDRACALDLGAYGDGSHDDTAAIQKTLTKMLEVGRRRVELGPGRFLLGSQIVRPQGAPGIAWSGVPNSPIYTVASSPVTSMLVWTGGSTSMIKLGSSYDTFSDLGLENQGTATDGIELDVGCIGPRFERFGAMRPNGTPGFSRSIIRSNGNRLGYSKFRDIWANSPAPRFIDIDGQGATNGITTIEIDGGVFGTSNAAMVLVYAKDVLIEILHMHDMTLNQYAGNQIMILDTTDTPRAITINTLKIANVEFDAANTDNAAYRFGKFVNVQNIAFDGNKVNGGGMKTHAFDIANTNVGASPKKFSVVRSVSGNYWANLSTALFDVKDSLVKVRDVGANAGNRPPHTVATAALNFLDYGPSIVINGQWLSGSETECMVIDATNSSGFTISVDTTSPEFMSIGQEFVVHIRNVTAGVIAPGTFGSTFSLSNGATVAPAAGFGRVYRFIWNGSKAIEIGARGGDVANT